MEPPACTADPESCRAVSLAIFEVIAQQNPDADIGYLVEVVQSIDYTSIEYTPNRYTYVGPCSQTQQ